MLRLLKSINILEKKDKFVTLLMLHNYSSGIIGYLFNENNLRFSENILKETETNSPIYISLRIHSLKAPMTAHFVFLVKTDN